MDNKTIYSLGSTLGEAVGVLYYAPTKGRNLALGFLKNALDRIDTLPDREAYEAAQIASGDIMAIRRLLENIENPAAVENHLETRRRLESLIERFGLK